MKPARRVFVVGGAHSPYTGVGRPGFVHHKDPEYAPGSNPSLEDHLSVATLGALEAAHVAARDVDKAYVANFLGECFANQGHLGALLASVHDDLEGKPIARMEAACASGGVAIAACVDALQGSCDVALAVGVEVETGVATVDGVDYMARAAHWETSRGWDRLTFPYVFARRARHYKEAFGATTDDLARVVVKAYGNASRNPLAHMQSVAMTFEHAANVSPSNRLILRDETYAPHIRQSDCTTFTDGASAVVLATEGGLRRLGISTAQCTEILGIGHTVRSLRAETDPTRMVNLADAASQAYAAAGIGPGDLEMAEVHDCFSVAELQAMEALQLCGPGEAPAMLASGATAIDGSIPINPGGGLLGFGHPVGATGVKQVVEIWRQMKGRAGAYQLARPPSMGVSANIGGDDRTGVVMIHRNCG